MISRHDVAFAVGALIVIVLLTYALVVSFNGGPR